MANQQPEWWLRGPVDNIIPELQPVAHALLQARDEINTMMMDFPEDLLWEKPVGIASPAFHLQHIPGVLDRLFSYADALQLSAEQLQYLSMEGKRTTGINLASLMDKLNVQFDISIQRLRNIKKEMLTEKRGVGRKALPSSVTGLLFHAAEHTMRHTGQLLVTTVVLKEALREKYR